MTRRRTVKERRRANPSVSGFLTVGQAARVLGVSPSTLRQWENTGLIIPVRSQGRFRLYSPELLAVLKRIKYLRDVKQLRVPGIKDVLDKHLCAKPGNRLQSTANLGTKLRRLRKACKLSLVEVARRVQISAGFLSAVELSQANASIATLQRLAAPTGTSDKLLRRSQYVGAVEIASATVL